jgi:hypothetical protein
LGRGTVGKRACYRTIDDALFLASPKFNCAVIGQSATVPSILLASVDKKSCMVAGTPFAVYLSQMFLTCLLPVAPFGIPFGNSLEERELQPLRTERATKRTLYGFACARSFHAMHRDAGPTTSLLSHFLMEHSGRIQPNLPSNGKAG